MKVIITKRFPFKPYVALTCNPWVFIRQDYIDEYGLTDQYIRTLNHEKIHIEQQKELGLFRFFTLYLWWFLKWLPLGWGQAYRNIPFEAEAYSWAHKLDYLADRTKNAWKLYK